MAGRDLYTDSSSHAAGELDRVLHQSNAEVIPTVSIEEALRSERLVEHASDRDITRVLFISKDTALLSPVKQTLDGYINISDMFDEVHILVMRTGIAPRQLVLRPSKNVWIYTVAATHWWQLPAAARVVLERELKFATGFRPDLIVARDPLESGLVALQAASDYNRPAQLHITKSTYSSDTPIGFLHRLLAWYTVPQFTSVRVTNKMIWNRVRKRVTTKDFALLPHLNPHEAILETRQTLGLHQQYPQYIFTMLFVGQLEEGSTVLEVIDAATEMLRNSSVALIIIGDGPLKADCKRRAKALGIEKQIVYLASTVDVVQYLKAAHLVFITDTDEFSEDIMMQAAYAHIPMLLSTTDHRLDLFSHLQSAYFCEPHQIAMLAAGLFELMNDVELRKQLASQALVAVQEYFHNDPTVYQRRYRESIEEAFFTSEN